jgi:DNA-binding response OmpR family regulator
VAIEVRNEHVLAAGSLATREGETRSKRAGLAREVLLDEAWGYEDYPNTRTVDNHLVKLRRALEDEPDKPRWLVTIHGAGYKLDVVRESVRWAGGRSPA